MLDTLNHDSPETPVRRLPTLTGHKPGVTGLLPGPYQAFKMAEADTQTLRRFLLTQLLLNRLADQARAVTLIGTHQETPFGHRKSPGSPIQRGHSNFAQRGHSYFALTIRSTRASMVFSSSAGSGTGWVPYAVTGRILSL